MVGFLRQREVVLIAFTSSFLIMMILHVVSGMSLSSDCILRPQVLRQTWRHPCRGTNELPIAASDEVTEAATPASVESTMHHIRLLKQESAGVQRDVQNLKSHYATERLDEITLELLEQPSVKSPEFPDLPPLTLIEFNEVARRSAQVLTCSSLVLQRAIISERCNEPPPMDEALGRIQNNVHTMLCRLHQAVYPSSIDSLLSNDTLQVLGRISNSYDVPLIGISDDTSSNRRYWVDYVLLRNIANAMATIEQLYADLIQHN